jgi:phage gp16-like protein
MVLNEQGLGRHSRDAPYRDLDMVYSSQIDFVLTRRGDKRTCVNCKVIPRECVVAQHKLVVADFRFLVQARGNKQARVARTKWWKLEGEASKVFKENVIEEGP